MTRRGFTGAGAATRRGAGGSAVLLVGFGAGEVARAAAEARPAAGSGTLRPKFPARIAKSVPLTAPSPFRSPWAKVTPVLPKFAARRAKSVPSTVRLRL